MKMSLIGNKIERSLRFMDKCSLKSYISVQSSPEIIAMNRVSFLRAEPFI